MSGAEPGALVVAILHAQPLYRLLRAGADPTVRDQAGLTPLHHAVLAGNVEAVEALLDHAAKRTRPLRRPNGDPSQAIGSPWDLVTAPGPLPSRPAPLHLAAERNETLLRLMLGHSSLTSVGASFLGITLSSRPQPGLLQLRDARGWSLLHYAVSRANLTTLRLLLQHTGAAISDGGSSSSSRSSSLGGAGPHEGPGAGAGGTYSIGTIGVNAPDADSRTALHQAAALGHAECCRLLLKAGADQAASSGPPEGSLPLHLAAMGNHTATVEMLFRHAVAQQGFRAAQSVLLRPNAAGLTALHVAALTGAVDAARRLLHLVFPFDTRGPLGRTALHLAALRGSTSMINMLLGHSTPQQRQLRDAEGFTAVHLAAAAGRLDALRVLVAGGCSVDARATATASAPPGCAGWTPLHCAVRRGDVAVIELLIGELGADPFSRDEAGRTPCDLAVTIAAARGSAGGGSSISNGVGSGQQGLDDTPLGPLDANAAEPVDESSGNSSPDKVRAATSAGLGSLPGLVAGPLQGPSVSIGHVSHGDGKLEEGRALAVLQTFVRLLHEPLQRRGALPPSLLAACGETSSLLGGGSSGPDALAAAPRAPRPLGAHAEGHADVAAAQSAGVVGAVAGAITAARAPGYAGAMVNGGLPTNGQSQLPAGSPGEAATTPVHGTAGGTHVVGDTRAGHLAAAGGAGGAEARTRASKGGGHHDKSKDRRLSASSIVRMVVPGGYPLGKRNDSSRRSSRSRKANAAVEAPSVALAYAAQMLAAPAATPTRASPFSKPTAPRASPFQPPGVSVAKPAAALAVAPAVAPATAAASASDTAAASSATATTSTTAIVGTHTGSATSATAASTLSANGVVAPAAAAPPAAPLRPKPSPFLAATKASPFSGAPARAASPPAPSAGVPTSPPQQQQQPPLDDNMPAPVIAAAFVEAPAANVSPSVVAAAAPAAAQSGRIAAGDDSAPAADAAEQQLPVTAPASAPPPAPTGDMTMPFTTTGAAALSAIPEPVTAPASEPTTCLHILSPINNPCGYSALNRAILLQRQAITEALLATLPSEGHVGGVLVLSGLLPSQGRSAGASATLSYNAFRATGFGTGPNAGIGVVLSSFQSRTLSPTHSQLHHQPPLGPAVPSQEPSEPATAAKAVPPHGAHIIAPASSLLGPLPQPRPLARPATGNHHQLQPRGLLQLAQQRQFSGGIGQEAPTPPAAEGSGSQVTRDSVSAAPPLQALCGPGCNPQPNLTAGPQPGASSLVSGVLTWDEGAEVFRTLPPNHSHTGRAWLQWPGELEPSTGWLLAELVVVEAGAQGGHVWFGLGPKPEVLAATVGSYVATGSFVVGGGAAPDASLPASVAGSAPVQANRVGLAVPAALLPSVNPTTRTAAGSAAVGPVVSACAVINHPSTYVVCLRDGQAFRGGSLTQDLGAAQRLEARSGDTVALFWNLRAGNAAFTLNGRYCGRLTGLPNPEKLAPIVGLQCGGFMFRWRCKVSAGSGSSAGFGSPKGEAAGRDVPSANVDALMVREQMLHEDPETPWLCKPSMISLHFAAWVGNTRVLPQLVHDKKFQPDEPDSDGWTALHFAALAGQVEAVELLLELGCYADPKSKCDSTPVLLAAKYGRSPDHVVIVRMLADAGSELRLRDPRGRTLLMLAAKAGNLAMVQLLLERGLDPSATDCQDREAQQYAGQHGAIFRLLRTTQAAQRTGVARKGKRRQQRQQRQQRQLQQQQQPRPQQPEGSPADGSAAGVGIPVAHNPGAAGVADQEEQDEGNDEDDDDEDGVDSQDSLGGGGKAGGRHLDVQHLPLLAERWRLGAEQLVRGRLIEQGAFGAVFEGTWCGARVAIKQVLRRRTVTGGGAAGGSEPLGESVAASLEREVAILTALPPHERIARMLGSLELPGEGVCLVMAFYPHTLQGVMQSERLRRSWLTPVRRAAIARQLAEGLAFLHGLPGPRVIHRDLKPNNVLLEAAPSLGVKICDFGLSRILAGSDVQSSSGAGHAFWMAPELLRALAYDEKVDVYSFGVIMYQLAYWVDDQLYGGLNKAQVDFQVVHGMLRLQERLPGGIDPAVQALVRECLDEDPRARPTMAQVCERLAGVRELPQPSQAGQLGNGQQGPMMG